MSTVNTKRTKSLSKEKQIKEQLEIGHLNHMNGISYDISNPILKLRIVASSCFFGEPMYYHNEDNKKLSNIKSKKTGLSEDVYKYLEETLDKSIDIPSYHSLSPSKLMEKVIDDAILFDPEATLFEAVRLRNEDNIRVTPQVIMVRAANSSNVRGTNLISKFAQQIMKRTDDAVTQLAYQISTFGKPIPNSLKKAWKNFLIKKDDYQLAKYKMENKQVKLVDLINLTHAHSSSIHKLMNGELKLNETTWESYISKHGSNKETWSHAISLMGHMALLRNLRNFEDNNVDENLYLDKLIQTVDNGKQLPFRYYSAYKAIKNNNKNKSSKVLDTIEECLELSLKNVPQFKGKVMSLCDNSGSAHGTMTSSYGSVTISDIANLTGVITGKCAEDGYVGIFGDKLDIVPIRKKSSIFDQLKEITTKAYSIGQGTENGIWLFFDKAIKEKQHWDHIFVYSDMQAGHGGLYGEKSSEYSNYKWNNSHYIDVAALIKDYRKKVNKDVKVYLVQMAGYQDTLIPEFYKDTYILGGWGDGLLRFADKMSKITNI